MSFIVLDLPIEPIEGRYSIQWAEWFKLAYERNNIYWMQIHGDAFCTDPDPEKFLDPYTTFQWKFSQLNKTVEVIRGMDLEKQDRIIVFLHDGWFPGIECFPYIRDMLGIDIKICAFWHAGSYDDTDLLGIKGMDRWVQTSEMTWFNLCDAIFVGSEYHKQRLLAGVSCDCRDVEKVYVTGCPVEIPKSSGKKKEEIVVWPHRISEDKHPEIFDKLSQEERFRGVRFIKTKERHLSKAGYYALLDRAKVAVSTATHENFGIAMVESYLSGCIPITPKGLAYDESMPKVWQYHSYEDLAEKVSAALHPHLICKPPEYNPYNPTRITDRICRIIKEVGESD